MRRIPIPRKPTSTSGSSFMRTLEQERDEQVAALLAALSAAAEHVDQLEGEAMARDARRRRPAKPSGMSSLFGDET